MSHQLRRCLDYKLATEEGAEQEIADALDKRCEEALAPLGRLVDEFRTALSELDDAVAEDLTDLALATGRQLADDALKARPRQVVELVQRLLHTDPPLVGRQRLWLHPLDLRLVERHLGEQLEAATAAARAGARTALVTQNADTVGEMSCMDPALTCKAC